MKISYRQESPPRKQNAILLFARMPELDRSIPDEPYAALPWEELDALSVALFSDLIEQALAVPGADVIFCCRESDNTHNLTAAFPERLRSIVFPDGPLSATVSAMIEHAFDLQYQRAILILDATPLRSPEELQKMFARLNGEDDCIVMTASPDGFCSVLGLRSTHRSMFHPVSPNLFEKADGLLAFLCEQSAVLCPTPPEAVLNSGLMIARLRDTIVQTREDAPGYPKRTATIFRQLDKKYRMRRP
jgi:hypothetical protein